MDKRVYKQALKNIRELKEKVTGLTFEQAKNALIDNVAYDDEILIDVNYYSIGATFYNKEGKADLQDNFEVYEDMLVDGSSFFEVLSQDEIEKLAM